MFIALQNILQALHYKVYIPFGKIENNLIYCQEDVIKAMKKAWSHSSNSNSGVEAGFRLDGTPEKYTIVPNRFTNQQNHQTLEITNKTFAIFHVHPNKSSGNPSTPDNNYLGNK